MALKAHLDPPVPSVDDRRQPRRAMQLETSGVLPGGLEANVTVHNLSAAGLLLETDLDLVAGETLAIDLPEAGQVDAEIVWQSGRLYGCAFAETLEQPSFAAAQLQSTPAGSPLGTAVAYPESFGVRLNRLRRERGLTLAQVASALDVSKPTVWAWEKGKARPLPERIEAIAAALAVSVEELGQGDSAQTGNSLVEDCRLRIATAFGTQSQNIRIMIEV